MTPESFAEVLLRTGKLAEAKTEGRTPFPATEGKRRGDRTPKTPFNAYALMRARAPPPQQYTSHRGETRETEQSQNIRLRDGSQLTEIDSTSESKTTRMNANDATAK